MPTTLKGPELTERLKWRYATKVFDAAKKISSTDWSSLEQALVLTPSSYGLQPWKFLVVNDRALRQALLPHSWKQRQVVDCSHYVVFLRRTEMTAADVTRFIDRTVEVRNVPKESLDFYRDLMIGDLVSGPRHAWIAEWAARQVYIALGNFMTAAAVMGIDTCPMEGLDPSKYDEILKLEDSGYGTAVACAAGYRAAQDKYAALAKIRYPLEQVIIRL